MGQVCKFGVEFDNKLIFRLFTGCIAGNDNHDLFWLKLTYPDLTWPILTYIDKSSPILTYLELSLPIFTFTKALQSMHDNEWYRHAKSQEPGNLVPGHFQNKIRTFFRYQSFKDIFVHILFNYCEKRYLFIFTLCFFSVTFNSD